MVKVIVGGARSPEAVAWSDDELGRVVTAELEQMLATRLSPVIAAVTRHQPGIPQYSIGHDGWLAGVDRLRALVPGLHLTGWGYRAVGVAGLATDAARVAHELVTSRAGGSGSAA